MNDTNSVQTGVDDWVVWSLVVDRYTMSSQGGGLCTRELLQNREVGSPHDAANYVQPEPTGLLAQKQI
jgi:hypothetical protein